MQRDNFETVYARLEETVRRLEEGGLTLDQSIALFEEGMGLAGRCRSLLDEAELRITDLQQQYAGALTDGEDDGDDEDDEDAL